MESSRGDQRAEAFSFSCSVADSPSVHPCSSGSEGWEESGTSRFSVRITSGRGFWGGSVVKNLPAKTVDAGSIPGSERSPEEGNDNPLQSSYLGNPTDGGAWWTTVRGLSKSPTRL